MSEKRNIFYKRKLSGLRVFPGFAGKQGEQDDFLVIPSPCFSFAALDDSWSFAIGLKFGFWGFFLGIGRKYIRTECEPEEAEEVVVSIMDKEAIEEIKKGSYKRIYLDEV